MLIRSAPGSSPIAPELTRRMRYLVAVLALAFLGLAARLWQLQVVRGEQYFERARSNVVAEKYLPSVRGKILDRNGKPMADNRPAFNLYITPSKLDADQKRQLIGLLDLSAEEIGVLDEHLEQARERGTGVPSLVLEDQGRDRAALVAQYRQLFPAVEVHDEPYRHYPEGELAAHLLGYMNHLTAKELEELAPQGYEPSEFIGRYGLERKFEHYLRGKKGIERYVVNARGERIDERKGRGLIEGPEFVPPVAGHNIRLTIDLELQKLVEQEVAHHAAAAVAVVEAKTGRVRALVSTPAFDPNVMTGKLTKEEAARMNSDPRKPFVDKTLRQHYPPGSTFKFVTAAIAIDDGVIDPQESLFCPGYHMQGKRTFRCMHTHERVNLLQAIQHSCNVYFWKVAERIGIDRIAEVALDFGLGAPTGIGLNGDVPGRVPTRTWYEQRDAFKIGYTLNTATGQGDVEVTVLQLAMAYAAIANGGYLYVPQVVERIEAANGQLVASYDPTLRRKVDVSAHALELLRRGMSMVVNEPGGTAYEARSEIVAFAGKTGTAQVRSRRRDPDGPQDWNEERDHAWFAGFAPAEDAEIAIVVLIEHGGSGGKVAGRVAGDIIDAYFRAKNPVHDSGGAVAPEVTP